jgi:hypothetical protein
MTMIPNIGRANRSAQNSVVLGAERSPAYHVAIVAAVRHGRVVDTIVARHTGIRVQHQARTPPTRSAGSSDPDQLGAVQQRAAPSYVPPSRETECS